MTLYKPQPTVCLLQGCKGRKDEVDLRDMLCKQAATEKQQYLLKVLSSIRFFARKACHYVVMAMTVSPLRRRLVCHEWFAGEEAAKVHCP